MDELTPEDLFNKMMEQQKAMNPITPHPGNPNQSIGMPGQPPALTVEEQATLNAIQTQVSSGTPQTNKVNPTQGECPECGMFHPPTGGKACPNAGMTSASSKEIDDGKVNTYLVQWKNIILAHIHKANIENWDEVFQEATLMFAKQFDGSKKNE